MILTDKAKEDFFNYYWKNIKWTYEDVEMFTQDNEIEQYAYIVDWFDSVGIHIYLSTGSYVSIPNFRYTIITQDDNCEGFKENSRKEATTQAIKKANNIYNERTKNFIF